MRSAELCRKIPKSAVIEYRPLVHIVVSDENKLIVDRSLRGHGRRNGDGRSSVESQYIPLPFTLSCFSPDIVLRVFAHVVSFNAFVVGHGLPEMELEEMEGMEELEELDLEDLWSLESMDTKETSADVVVVEPMCAEINCNAGAIQKSAHSLLKWRSVSLAISACNRMRLVMESLKAVDAEKAEQTGAEIKVAFAEPSQAPPPEPLPCPTAEERHYPWIATRRLVPKFTLCKYFRTASGKLRIEMESGEPVEEGNVYQVLGEVLARMDCVTSLSAEPVDGLQELGLPNMIPGLPPAQMAETTTQDCSIVFPSFLDLIPELSPEPTAWHSGEHDVGSINSATISTGDEAIHSGIIDQFSVESTFSVHQWEIYDEPGSDLPGSQAPGTSGVWTPSDMTSKRTETDVTESGQQDHQERHETSDSDSPLKTMEKDPQWKEVISDPMSKKICEIFDEINQASDRAKLQNNASEAKDCYVKLHKGVCLFEGEFNRMSDEVRTALLRVSRTVQTHIEQQLKRAITRVSAFGTKDLKHLLNEAGMITKKLEKIVGELRKRDLSASAGKVVCS
ncbi:unnamed protein product [Calypogeia fissa]